MWLDAVAQNLGWPTPDQITSPKGGGPSHYAQLVCQKIGGALGRWANIEVHTGVLSANPSGDSAEAPLAVVCEFPRPVSDDVLKEAQRLCWNFSRSSLLITLEPHRIQAWSCSLAPKKGVKLNTLRVGPEVTFPDDPDSAAAGLQSEAAQMLHWVNLISGEILRNNPRKFRKEQRADALLVNNLRVVRTRLITQPDDTNRRALTKENCHSLLARLIFTQFLFQRTDSDGRQTITPGMLEGRFDGALSKEYEFESALEEILRNKEDAYALFRWLNDKFNGDLFPGKTGTPEEREAEWKKEKDAVEDWHLDLLADFVGGKNDFGFGQLCLWPQYSFDTLPLEFISSVYEEFLNEDQEKDSAYYTPPHLVDFILDGVLPWSGTKWDLKILDPCCGSGIFLVKAFQRLVQRWRNANPDSEPKIDDLRGLLENNLFGVDRNREALRVASFSLCLALCDMIDPRQYWKRTLFPPLRDKRLIESDFFSDDPEGIRTEADAGKWDLVIGNAPWSDGELTEESEGMRWAKINGWPVMDYNPGPLFLAKAIQLTSKVGQTSMILPASSMLYQKSSEKTLSYRKKLFESYRIDEVVSLAALRWILFKGVKSPACVFTVSPIQPADEETIVHMVPRPAGRLDDKTAIQIDTKDIHYLSHREAAEDDLIWTVFLLGGRRDRNLIQRLSKAKTLRKLKARQKESANDGKVLLVRGGIKRGTEGFTPSGKNKQRDDPRIVGRRILEAPEFPGSGSTTINAEDLPINQNPKLDHLHGLGSLDAFNTPQLLIKRSLSQEKGGFQARLIISNSTEGVLCSQSYLSVHQFNGSDDWIKSACLMFCTSLSSYCLTLTSRLGSDRGEAHSGDILDLPIPSPDSLLSGSANTLNLDALVEKAFGLAEADHALVSDLLAFGYREGGKSRGEKPARERTFRIWDEEDEIDLDLYAEFFIKALRATFGKNKAIRATIFEESQPNDLLPMRMIAIHLDWRSRRQLVKYEKLKSADLRTKMGDFYRDQLGMRSRDGHEASGIGFQRDARIFFTHETDKGERIPSVLYIKPDQRRCWTRSSALRDADDLAASILEYGQQNANNS